MSLDVMLDEIAADALAAHRIDYESMLLRAQDRVGQRVPSRAAERRQRALVVLAVAAIAVLITVLLPLTGVLRGDAQPADQPAATGVPAQWYYAPPWTPPVTRHPMTAAVMVLSVSLRTGADGPGPVLVSADAKTYASLPGWGRGDGGVTLSADGRRVAWWTVPRQRTDPVFVHLLTLADGTRHDQLIQPGTPSTMTWAGNDVYVAGQWGGDASGEGNWPATFKITLGGAMTNVCGCRPLALGSTGAGRLAQVDAAAGTTVRGAYNAINSSDPGPERTDRTAVWIDDIAARTLVLEPTGRNAVAVTEHSSGSWHVQTGPQITKIKVDVRDRKALEAAKTAATENARRTDHMVRLNEQVTSVKALASNPAGIVLLVTSSKGPGEHVNRSIQLMDADTGQLTVIAEQDHANGSVPVAIAAGLVHDATPIPAPQPSFDVRDRAHLQFLAGRAWSLYRGPIIAAGAALLLALLGAGLLIRRRRRPMIGGSATGSAV